jgi:alkylated DNA repair dioxygenase AlkB
VPTPPDPHLPRPVSRYDGAIVLYPALLAPDVADRLFEALLERVEWRQERIRMFGREVLQPRLVAWHGDPGRAYTYSGLTLRPRPWTPELLEVRRAIEEVRPGAGFNSVLLNLYRDGRDSMGWHADDEPELGREPAIASVSLGAERTFQLKHRTRDDVDRIDLTLPHGSLLWMAGPTQHCWKHRLPKRAGEVGPRINLTFRRIVAA